MAEVIKNTGKITHREDVEKIATLDMNGTLVDHNADISTHARINTALGLSPEKEQSIYDRYEGENGDIDNHRLHAYERTLALEGSEEANIENYAEAIQEIIEERKVLEGAHGFIETLHDQGYTPVVVSSAPPPVSRPYAEELNIGAIYNWKNLEFYEDGSFARVYVSPEGKQGKQGIVRAFQEQGAEVIHFGNGANDLDAIDEADAGFRQYWTSDPEEAYEWARKEAAKL